MRRQRILLAIAMLIAAAVPARMDACEVIFVASSAELLPDDQRTALSGIVVGYVADGREAGGIPFVQRGLLVDVDTGVPAVERMRWYFGGEPGSDCSNQPGEDALHGRFPIGRRVATVETIRSAEGDGLRWIVDTYAGTGQIAGVPVDRLPTPGRFGFAAYTRRTDALGREILRRHGASNSRLTDSEAWSWNDRLGYQEFEWYRTLVYARTVGEREREAILRRMAWYGPFTGKRPSYTRTHYMDVVDWVGVSDAARRRLFDAFHGRRE